MGGRSSGSAKGTSISTMQKYWLPKMTIDSTGKFVNKTGYRGDTPSDVVAALQRATANRIKESEDLLRQTTNPDAKNRQMQNIEADKEFLKELSSNALKREISKMEKKMK